MGDVGTGTMNVGVRGKGVNVTPVRLPKLLCYEVRVAHVPFTVVVSEYETDGLGDPDVPG